jgi:hypothetical protein
MRDRHAEKFACPGVFALWSHSSYRGILSSAGESEILPIGSAPFIPLPAGQGPREAGMVKGEMRYPRRRILAIIFYLLRT